MQRSSIKIEAQLKLVAFGGCGPTQSVQLYWCLLVCVGKTISTHTRKSYNNTKKFIFMRYSIFGILVQHAADVLQLSSLAIHMDHFLMFHYI